MIQRGVNPTEIWFLGRTDHSHQEEGLNLGHSSPQHCAHVVTHSSKQYAKHGDAHQGVTHAEQLAVPRPRRQVPKTCPKKRGTLVSSAIYIS